MYVLGVLIIVIGVAVSIALHEIGHLVPAKKFGVRCTQYMVGFGPTVWSRRRGETEYGIKAIPLGGYVRMIGMFPPRKEDDGKLRSTNTGRFGTLIESAREESLEEVRPGDEDRVFYKLSTPKKITVMLGGPLMNLLIAAVLLTGINTFYGMQQEVPGARVASVTKCVVPASQASTVKDCPTANTPAAMAGLLPGDLITSIGGEPVRTTSDVGRIVRPAAGKSLPVVVQRTTSDGATSTHTLTMQPVPNQMPKLDAQGHTVTGADGKPVYETTGFIGVTNSQAYEIVRQPLSKAPGYVLDATGRTFEAVLNFPAKLVGVAKAAFGSETRDPNGPMSVVGVGRIGGEIASADVATYNGGETTKYIVLLQLIASLNLALFVFNLIPLLPLDGGHIAGAIWEGLKRTWARLRRLPDPGHVDVAKALPLTYAVAIVLLTMSALLIYADIVRPVKIFG